MQVQDIRTVSALMVAVIAVSAAATAPTLTITPAEPPAGTFVSVHNPALEDNSVCTVTIDQVRISDCSQLAPGDHDVVVQVPPDTLPGTHTLAMEWYPPKPDDTSPEPNDPDVHLNGAVSSASESLLLDDALRAEAQFVVPEWHLDQPTGEELTSDALLEVTGRGFAPGGECWLTIEDESAPCSVDDAGGLTGEIDLPTVSTATELQLDATNLIRADLTQSDSLVLAVSPSPTGPTTTPPTTPPTTPTGEPTGSSTDSSPGETPNPTSSQTAGLPPPPAGPTATPPTRPVSDSGIPWLSLGLATIAVVLAAALLLRTRVSPAAMPTVRLEPSGSAPDRLQVRAPSSPTDLSLRVVPIGAETTRLGAAAPDPFRHGDAPYRT